MDTVQPFDAKAQLKVESFDGNDFINFNLKLKCESNSLKNASRQKNYQIVIDNSGSMSGTNIQLTKDLCLELVDYIIKNQPNSKVSLMTFNTSINHNQDLQKQLFHQVKQFISNIVATDGTIFHITFDKLAEICQKFQNQNEELVVVYLTDGQVQSSQDTLKLKESFQFLQQVLHKFVNNVEIHALGMGKDHDAVILDKIIQLQTTQSTYQFIKESSEIDGAFKNIVDIIGQNFIEAYLQRKDGQLCRIPLLKSAFNSKDKQKNCILIDNETKEKIFKNAQTQDVMEEIKNNFELVLNVNHTNRIVFPFSIKDKRQQKGKGESYEDINQQYNYLDTKLKVVIQQLKEYINTKRSSVDKEQIKKFSDQINQIKTIYNSSLIKFFRLSSLEREKINNNNPALSQKVKEASEIVEKLLNSAITTVEIAILNQLSYTNITNRLFAKRLEKRKGASIQQFNDYEVLKDKFQAEFQSKEKELQAEFKDLSEEIGTCFLSCYDIPEALLNKDCLCVTFSVTRSELAIVRPESLKIRAVQPSVISAKSFIDCVQYSLDISLENSGQFNKKEGTIVQGMMREVINAAMPLYIHEDHWKMAKLWLEPILGWVVTLDPLGYHHAQKRTIPFMLLNYSIRQMIDLGITKYGLKQMNLILRTCSQIMQEEDQDSAQLEIEKSQALKIREEITKQYEGFMSDASQRLGEKVTNIEIFLAKLYIASTLKWITIKKEDLKQFFRYVIEEQLRRNMADYYTKYTTTQLVQLIDGDNYLFKGMTNEITTVLNSTLCIVHFYRHLFNELSQEECIIQTTEITKTKVDTFSILMADDIEQIKAMFVQNVIQGQDKVRRANIGLKKYSDPYLNQQDIYSEIRVIKNNEVSSSVSYMDTVTATKKYHVPGTISFTCPDISTKLKPQMKEIATCDSIDQFKTLFDDLYLKKQNKQWYLWCLIAMNASNLDEKLKYIKEKYGAFKKFKNYHSYVLTLGKYLDHATITYLETP